MQITHPTIPLTFQNWADFSLRPCSKFLTTTDKIKACAILFFGTLLTGGLFLAGICFYKYYKHSIMQHSSIDSLSPISQTSPPLFQVDTPIPHATIPPIIPAPISHRGLPNLPRPVAQYPALRPHLVSDRMARSCIPKNDSRAIRYATYS